MKTDLESNIVLTGFMGTGKSTIGKVLAERLDKKFIDTDEVIEERENRSISEIFSLKGEQYFRNVESKVIDEVSQARNVVIATGGGVVLKEENIDFLRKNGIIIHLKADVETIIRNTSKSNNRPLLEHQDIKNRIIDILTTREHCYKNNDYEIDVSHLTVQQVVNRIMEFIKK